MDVSAFTAPATTAPPSLWSLLPEDLDDDGDVDEELRFSSIHANKYGDLTRILAAVFDEDDEEEDKQLKQQPTDGSSGGRAHAKTTDEQHEAPQSVHTDTLPTHAAEMIAAKQRGPDKRSGRSAVVHQAASSGSVPTTERPPTRPTNSSPIQHGTRPAEVVHAQPPLPPTRPMDVERPAPAIQHAVQPKAAFRFVQQPPPMRPFQVVQPSTLMIRQEFVQLAPCTQPFVIIQQQIFIEHSPFTQLYQIMQPPIPPASPSVAASSSSPFPSPPIPPTRPQPPVPSTPAASTRTTSASSERNSSSDFDDVSVFVNGVHVDTQESELRVFFRAYRPIKRVTIVRDHATKGPHGYAYVMFADSATREDALMMDGRKLHGQCVQVKPKLVTRKGHGRNHSESRPRADPSPSERPSPPTPSDSDVPLRPRQRSRPRARTRSRTPRQEPTGEE